MVSIKGDRANQRLGNYQLKQCIGQGGFAEVYLGEHVLLKTLVAVKILSTRLAQEDQEHFLTEARILARLKHPHILSILDFGVQDGTPFLVMEYAPNGNLREYYQKSKHITPIMTLFHLKQVASALQYAHQEQIIHRDVKPENILLGSHGEALLGDFGMALGIQSSRTQNMADIAGTATYMAPELLEGHPVPVSDQYSLAIVLYEWLSGATPFHGTFTEIASQHITTPPPTIKAPSVSSEVEAVIFRALAKLPEQRFENVQAFVQAFEEATLAVDQTFKAPAGWLPPGIEQQYKTVPSLEKQPTKKQHINYEFPILTKTVRSITTTQKAHSRKSLSKGWVITLVLLTLMIATSGFALAYFGFNIGRSHSNQEDQATTQATITAWQNKYAEVTREKPFLSDPLNQNINKWDNGSSTNRSCLFTNGTYHVSSLTPYALGLCASNAASDFNNIGYQVDMTILHGDEGGLVFRLTTPSPTQILTYIFSVNRKGTYNLWVANGHYSTLLYRSSSAIKTGLNQSNLLCIIAQGKHIALYINKHYVASVIDTSATTGAIGLFARSLSDTTDVAFSNLKLWRL